MSEWIITNGLGGYAASTDKGFNTRRYHGMLIAPMNPPGLRKLVLSKVDESIEIGSEKYNLYSNKTRNSSITQGEKYLKRFQKDIIPIYTYKIKNVVIEKSVCLLYRKNTVAIVYRISNQKEGAKLYLTPIVNFRDFHAETHNDKFEYIQNVNEGKVQINFKENDAKINMCVTGSEYKEYINNIFYGMYYEKEEERGFDAEENHAVPGTFEIEIKPNEDKEITFLCSVDGQYGNTIEELKELNGSEIIKNEIERINKQIEQSKLIEEKKKNEEYVELIKRYIVASDNFIVYRPMQNLHTIIAGYPWFLDWGRDSLISFEGLLLIARKFHIAEDVLLTFANNIKEGIVPNGFDEYDGHALYNSADASLLFFEQVQKYINYTKNYNFVKENLYDKMIDIIQSYISGTNIDGNNIKLDEQTYLISSGTLEIQNTWMDAKVNNVPVTPRNGVVVEINAMWYNSLKIMQNLAKKFEDKSRMVQYQKLAKECKKSFEKLFYNPNKKCLYDVLGDDKIRPNQIFALSMTYPILDCDKEVAKEVFLTVTQKLLNRYGLQTLAKGEQGFEAIYEGSPNQRDSRYHQGITWVWLLGSYYDALSNMIKSEKNTDNKKELIYKKEQLKINVATTFTKEMTKGNTIGSICEIYDSKYPSRGKGAFAQGWSISEVFRIILDK